ncbi:glycosyltransferase family 2 protein [Rhodococcus sp. PML026]|uniref:glycosyltransferase family 2 protein n=1 Tax=Rhodococcus sp. PML026 TaxID=1356405 RepID=UPI0018CE1FA4
MRNFDDLTVVIPAYNAEKTLSDSIRSVSDRLRCRIIVVDDGSTDHTSEVANQMGAEIKYQPNAGASAARYAGIRLVNTQYVILLDSDDRLADGMMAAIDVIRRNSDVVAVGGRVAILGPSGKTQRVTRPIPSTWTTQTILGEPNSPWPPAAAVWRTDAIRASLRIDPDRLRTKFAEDFELLIRVSTLGKVAAVSDTTCNYRADGGKSARSSQAAVLDSEKIRAYYSRAFKVDIDLMSTQAVSDQAKWRHFRACQAASGLRSAAFTLLLEPSSLSAVIRHHARNTRRRMKRNFRSE